MVGTVDPSEPVLTVRHANLLIPVASDNDVRGYLESEPSPRPAESCNYIEKHGGQGRD